MRTVRVVSYAINGRGMGHLVRQVAIARWMRRYLAVLGVHAEQWVLTSSEADTLARREGLLSLKIPSKSAMRDAGVDPARYLAVARAWVLQTVVGLQPDLLLVDTFPAGSFGELIAALELVRHRVLVARPVRDEVAREQGWQAMLPLYHKVIVPEPGGVGPIVIREREELPSRGEARRALGAGDGPVVWLSLGGGGDPAAPGLLTRLVDALRGRGMRVVVAAGPLYAGPELRADGVVWLDRYVAMELLPGVDVAVSAGGYNSWHELMSVGVPTVFLPQPRIADDQEGRVARAVAAGMGVQAARVEDVPQLVEDLIARERPEKQRSRDLVPGGGAARAAAEALSLILPENDVRMAVRSFPPALLALPAARSLAPGRLVEVVRALAGEAPSRWAERRAAALAHVDAGHLHGKVPEAAPAGAPVERFLARIADLPGLTPEDGAQILLALVRKWPAATGAELDAAAARLLPALAAYGDPTGAQALLRALPVQRTWPVTACADALADWLEARWQGGGDLFDAQRALLRTETRGARSLAETLRLLGTRPDDAEEGLL